MVAAMAGFSLSDVLVQKAGVGLPALELACLRYGMLLLTVLPLLARQRGLWRSQRPWLQVARATGLVGSAVLFLQGLKTLPIAEATALVFASPLYVTILSALLLRERMRLWRSLPVLLGFVGVLVVAQPGAAGVNPAMVYPLLSSAAWAGAVICTRLLGGSDSTGTTMLYSSALGVLVLSPGLASADFGVMVLHWPWLLAMAASWCVAQWMVVLAYHQATPSAIAPFSYTQLIWAGLLGWLMFDQVPAPHVATGMAVIALSGALAAAMAHRTSVTQAVGVRKYASGSPTAPTRLKR